MQRAVYYTWRQRFAQVLDAQRQQQEFSLLVETLRESLGEDNLQEFLLLEGQPEGKPELFQMVTSDRQTLLVKAGTGELVYFQLHDQRPEVPATAQTQTAGKAVRQKRDDDVPLPPASPEELDIRLAQNSALTIPEDVLISWQQLARDQSVVLLLQSVDGETGIVELAGLYRQLPDFNAPDPAEVIRQQEALEQAAGADRVPGGESSDLIRSRWQLATDRASYNLGEAGTAEQTELLRQQMEFRQQMVSELNAKAGMDAETVRLPADTLSAKPSVLVINPNGDLFLTATVEQAGQIQKHFQQNPGYLNYNHATYDDLAGSQARYPALEPWLGSDSRVVFQNSHDATKSLAGWSARVSCQPRTMRKFLPSCR